MTYLRTGAFLVGMATVFVAIGSCFGTVEVALALSIAIVIAFWSFWNTPATLAVLGAREVTDSEVLALVDQLAAGANIPPPRVFEIDEHQPNAFALGPNPHQAVLIMTAGLRKGLSDAELGAVIGHELAHVHYRDTLTASLGATLSTAIMSLALPLGLIGLATRRNGGGAVLAFAVLAPLSAAVLYMAMGRSMEYRADRFGAELCGDPRHLIAALRKLSSAAERVRNETALAYPALSALHVVDPLPGRWLTRIFATHPPVERRIARLRRMAARRRKAGPLSHAHPAMNLPGHLRRLGGTPGDDV